MQSPETIKSNFGNHIKKLRIERGLTQEELADRANLHSTYIGQIERGLRNPSLVNLYKVANALNINANSIFPSE